MIWWISKMMLVIWRPRTLFQRFAHRKHSQSDARMNLAFFKFEGIIGWMIFFANTLIVIFLSRFTTKRSDHESRREFFMLFPKKMKSRFETSCRGSIYAWSRHYETHTAPTLSEGWYREWQTLLRTPIVESERLPKETAGPGLTSTLLPRNLEEEKTQHEERAKILW